MDEDIAYIRQIANEHRFLLEMWLNVKVTTLTHYAGYGDHKPVIGDVTDICERARAKGWII